MIRSYSYNELEEASTNRPFATVGVVQLIGMYALHERKTLTSFRTARQAE